MFATQILREVISESNEEDVSDVVGFIIVENKKYEVKKGETKIGRDAALCSVVIDNCTISKVHATIESEGVDDSFIYDVGSTNQTKLGKKVLKPHCRYKLDQDSQLTFGNVSAKFVLPSDSTNTDSVNPSSLDEMGDIFDMATQVSAPHTSASSKIPVIVKSQKVINTYKIPNSFYGKVEESPKSEITQCRIDSSETKSKTEFPESSNIFSLNTECQIYKPANEVNSNNLLNDGQDDILCTFMSLHSSKLQYELLKKTKIKTEVENSNQITGSQVEGNESKQIQKIFDSSCKKNNTITRLNSKFRQNQPNNVPESYNCTQTLKKEDPISQGIETQPYLSDILDGVSTRAQINELILSQAFETVEKSHSTTTTTVIIPECKNIKIKKKDIEETQTYDVEEEAKKINSTEARSHTSKDTECYVNKTLDFTQRDNQDDFIVTQIFKKEEETRKNDESSIASDDEDFIVTQPVELNTYHSSRNSPKTFSPEGSPDLLHSGSAQKNSEDFIKTQIFECQYPPFEKIDSCSHFDKKNKCNIEGNDLVESSGDETESDLEIILDKNETNTNARIDRSLKLESRSDNSTECVNLVKQEDIFEPEPDTHSEQIKTTIVQQKQLTDLSDSDATDCEEISTISPKILIKEERHEKIEFEETQVLTLSPPDNFDRRNSDSEDDWMVRQESPRFEIENDPCSPLSLEMPSSQDFESTLNKILHDEKEDCQTPSKIQKISIQVGFQNSNEFSLDKVAPAERQNDLFLKRPSSADTTEVVPIKKPKTDGLVPSNEKQFLKLVKAHDIAQIRPCRTRHSLRLLTKEKKDINLGNIANERPTSRRKSKPKKGRPKKLNGDITSFLKIKNKNETSLKENRASLVIYSRVLRSSLNKSILPVLTETFGRNTANCSKRRSSSKKKSEYYKNRRLCVVFTGFKCERLEKIVSDLGGEKSNDLYHGDVVVADKVQRTVKFLCATGLGLPIASPEWLLSCKKEKIFLDPWRFILRDEASEDKYGFHLKTSLERSKNTKLLQGFSVFATESTKPPVSEILAIVQCCGGTPILKPPNVWPKKTIVVSCLEDKKWWPPPKLRNIKVVHYEFILSGVLKQKIDFKTYELQ